MQVIYVIKGWYPNYIKNSYNLVAKNQKKPKDKGAEDLSKDSPKEDMQMANRYMK